MLGIGAPEARLLIAEAETGSGKTEAALNWFFRLFSAGEVDALYFALPTRVAARELYARICSYVAETFPDSSLRPFVVLAVPGYARVDQVPVAQTLPDERTRWHDDSNQVWQERTWAAERPKRFLAAPIAVGTIDQALLSTLQVRHAHLRSACLDRSLLVVDEVHASDSYMRRLLRSLLNHHVGLGGYALLLSATLGSRARAAFTGTIEPGFDQACAEPYPSLTDNSGIPNAPASRAASSQQRMVSIELAPHMEQPVQILSELLLALQAGARVLVVLNIVDRAIALQRAAESNINIEKAFFRCQGIVATHHGRFAPADREVLDWAVTDRLGRDSSEAATLLIGTQTLEQSLDIDADLLITDLCPMDVLLQRIGRLHRHKRERPMGHKHPRCIVLSPKQTTLENWLTQGGEACGAARRLGLGSVYDDMRVLQLTLTLLAEHPRISLPQDNRFLVESATHPESLATLKGDRWDRHAQKVEGVNLAQEIRAEYAALADLFDKPFGECRFHDPSSELKTRLGLNTLRVTLDRMVISPFGQSLTEIIIPGHLAPNNPSECLASVHDVDSNGFKLKYGGCHYRYSRFGLEKIDEPTG